MATDIWMNKTKEKCLRISLYCNRSNLNTTDLNLVLNPNSVLNSKPNPKRSTDLNTTLILTLKVKFGGDLVRSSQVGLYKTIGYISLCIHTQT